MIAQFKLTSSEYITPLIGT